ncbi:MAG TPA: ABC transporter ATP-binding protein [Mesorhizobium sp.]|jgi:iron complex transport system ATP-binding protein|uniref:ABC transporter ATP-binding protein n=1 Tax=Mesorhizobium sp. TaxID=1871066 RepID=UPI002DDDBB72|nr:ABC transporter ATP-binding protein [Mesorhizobium sp.]HEV2502706.1 ABC transporter ATP-binding protein [Mesorhizobium sp.]
MSLLAVSSLSAILGRQRVLHDVSFAVGPGEFVGLIGPNGAGKSTLLKAALGLVASRGRISIAGLDAATLGARERAARIAYVAQEHEIAWAIPVEAIVALGRTPHQPAFAALSSTDHAAIEQAMQRMEVAIFRDRAATDLSGGEKARVLIARALAQETPLFLADEPTAGLDPSHQITLMRVFDELAKQGRSVIASLHDLGLAARWCSRLILLDRGRIIADGPPGTVLTPESLANVYGVEAYFGTAAGRIVIQPLDVVQPAIQDKSEENHD